MHNLPFTLPACDQPATARIEVYSTTPTGESLDAAVYACTNQHVADAMAAIRLAGFTAHRTPLDVDVQRRCGAVHVFPTGRLAHTGHPAWCDRQDCAGRLEHRSPALPANPSGGELVDVRVALVQLTAAPTVTLIEVTFTDTPTDVVVRVLPLGQAVSLAYRVLELNDVAKGRQR
ncbi:hypothetical protein FXF53_20480 [Micromonospora sp. WP24]|uniref:hypothetical protein n=1 Tax=Micromonospora sp. WP24 TaxID=2604469 RepID=UPI0011D41C74|nr:hypothetical protein [Micromonospora sp. WP24]TYB97123.1 hypothetical protein FXF53_20480 [Micromonospora sp. WP24]